MKNNIVELPLVEPIYSTYHYQGASAAILADNPSIINWYLNDVMMLSCNRKFLKGFTTPEINIEHSEWGINPYVQMIPYKMEFLGKRIHYVIKRLLDKGYYVCFSGVDDYYVEGKTWYKERHFLHDGCICGYNEYDKTYCIYAYDSNWIYQKFWTPQKSFDKGRVAMFQKGIYGDIHGIKARDTNVKFSHKRSLKAIKKYLDSDMDRYPEDREGRVYGIVVHEYLNKYIGKLYNESIPYEKMDRRIFRMLWEHKKVMLLRIKAIESSLEFDNSLSEEYTKIVTEADNLRMLYASHHMKKRNSILPIIQRKLIYISNYERDILTKLLNKSKGEC